MSNGTMTERSESVGGGVIVRPQSVGMTQASQRVIAEAQAALTVAKAARRDEVDALDRIKNSCQRMKVAETAEYSFARGGQEISGPTIKLLEVVAAAWGNIQSGFRELSRANGESVVEAFAWDLETNNKKVMEFTVRHWRDTRSGGHAIKDERDIYELIANMAQRRVRKCLESVIPRDIVEEALEESARTLKARCELTPDRIKSMAQKFLAEYQVTTEQIEKRIQRRIDSITQAQFLSLVKVYNSLKDGMTKPEDWFEMPEDGAPAKSANQAAKDALKGQSSLAPFDAETIFTRFAGCETPEAANALCKELTELYPDKDLEISAMRDGRVERLPTAPAKKSKGDGKLPLNP